MIMYKKRYITFSNGSTKMLRLHGLLFFWGWLCDPLCDNEWCLCYVSIFASFCGNGFLQVQSGWGWWYSLIQNNLIAVFNMEFAGFMNVIFLGICRRIEEKKRIWQTYFLWFCWLSDLFQQIFLCDSHGWSSMFTCKIYRQEREKKLFLVKHVFIDNKW